MTRAGGKRRGAGGGGQADRARFKAGKAGNRGEGTGGGSREGSGDRRARGEGDSNIQREKMYETKYCGVRLIIEARVPFGSPVHLSPTVPVCFVTRGRAGCPLPWVGEVSKRGLRAGRRADLKPGGRAQPMRARRGVSFRRGCGRHVLEGAQEDQPLSARPPAWARRRELPSAALQHAPEASTDGAEAAAGTRRGVETLGCLVFRGGSSFP